MITKEQLNRVKQQCGSFFTTDEKTGNLTFRDPDNKIPEFTLVFVQGGEFTNYADKTVELSPFYMAEFQLTQELYTAITLKENPSRFQGINHPVDRVSWMDAVVCCNLLNEKIKGFPVCDSNYNLTDAQGKNTNHDIGKAEGFRLPTEAEWEYAARGGIKKEDSVFAGSNHPDQSGWYRDNNNYETKPVGLKYPNALGLYDMSGNVWEWCWDLYSTAFYEKPERKNPVNTDTGSRCVLRGGSWGCYNVTSRLSGRYHHSSSYRSIDVGFRLVWALQLG